MNLVRALALLGLAKSAWDKFSKVEKIAHMKKAATIEKKVKDEEKYVKAMAEYKPSKGISKTTKADPKEYKAIREKFEKKAPDAAKKIDDLGGAKKVLKEKKELAGAKGELVSLKRAEGNIADAGELGDTASVVARKNLSDHFIREGSRKASRSILDSIKSDKEAMKSTGSKTMKEHFKKMKDKEKKD